MLSTQSSMALIGARRFAATRGVATFTRSYPSFRNRSTTASPSRAAFFQHSFHPSIAHADATGRRKWMSLTAVAALAGLASICSLALSDSIKLEAAPPSAAASNLTTTGADASKQVVVDPDTGLSFPLYIPAPASFSGQPEPHLRLVGLGVRTVSFLRVRVYVAALYVDETKLTPLAASTTLEQHMKQLLDSGAAAVIRIVPVRNTDFNHLRDGFIRALQARLKTALKTAQLASGSPAEAQFTQAIQQVKESFPRGSVPKGSPLDLVVSAEERGVSKLNFEFGGEIFGQVEEKGVFTVARELVLAYFADKGEISAAFKRSVEQGMQVPASS